MYESVVVVLATGGGILERETLAQAEPSPNRRIWRNAGFRRVENLTGGILGWQREVDPTLARY